MKRPGKYLSAKIAACMNAVRMEKVFFCAEQVTVAKTSNSAGFRNNMWHRLSIILWNVLWNDEAGHRQQSSSNRRLCYVMWVQTQVSYHRWEDLRIHQSTVFSTITCVLNPMTDKAELWSSLAQNYHFQILLSEN